MNTAENVIDHEASAILYGKSNGTLAGIPFFEAIFDRVGCNVLWYMEEGNTIDVSNGKVRVAKVTGPCRKILTGERLALNILSRCCGVATQVSY